MILVPIADVKMKLNLFPSFHIKKEKKNCTLKNK